MVQMPQPHKMIKIFLIIGVAFTLYYIILFKLYFLGIKILYTFKSKKIWHPVLLIFLMDIPAFGFSTFLFGLVYFSITELRNKKIFLLPVILVLLIPFYCIFRVYGFFSYSILDYKNYFFLLFAHIFLLGSILYILFLSFKCSKIFLRRRIYKIITK